MAAGGLLAAAAVLGCNAPRYDASELDDGGRGGGSDAGQLISARGPDGGGPEPVLPDGGGGPAGPFLLSVATEGTGAGAVIAQPGGMCAGRCSATHPRGQTVSFTARATPPAVFGGWSGDCSGQGACTVVMDAARSVVARFDLRGVQWAQSVPRSTALMALPDGVLVGGAAFGVATIGDRSFDGGAATTPFLARLGADGKVQELKAYPSGSVSFGAISRVEGEINAAGFIGSATTGPRTAKLARLSAAGEVLAAVDRSNVDVLWNFGTRFLVMSANNGGLEMLDARGVALPNTQLARPFLVADAVSLADGGWAIGGQFVGALRLGDRTLSSTTGDWVVARWRADRSVVWAQTSPADKGARIERTTTNPGGNLLVAGNFTGQLQLLTQVFRNGGANALFVAKLAAANGSVIWGNSISAPLGVSCSALLATGDAVYLALASPGELVVEGVTFQARAVVVKYDSNTGAHVRSIPLDGSVLNLDLAPDALYALGDRLWKLDP